VVETKRRNQMCVSNTVGSSSCSSLDRHLVCREEGNDGEMTTGGWRLMAALFRKTKPVATRRLLWMQETQAKGKSVF
jgi:hypothetical protein